MVNATPRRFTLGNRLFAHCVVGWMAPGPMSIGVENFTPTGIRSPDRPARSDKENWKPR
jgi:hypothetical protein